MNKTQNISIASLPVIIDDDAYQLLKKYLDNISTKFKDDDLSELQKDVEVRILELLSDQGWKKESSIYKLQIVACIDQIGELEDFEETPKTDSKVAGSKLIVVLGHTKCGAVKGACDHVEMGNLTELLSKLQPAVYSESETTAIDKRNSKNAKFVENVASLNVKRGVKNIIERSFILEEMLDKGEIGIVGAMYNIDTGKVEFYKDVLYIKDEKNPKFSVAELRH